ncbi:MAG: hypothetical protein WBV71_17530 [Roseobacter sp.]
MTSVLNPHPTEFERFLYAPVGEDRNGFIVSVLSALARLGLDPWKETAELIKLDRETASERLGLLLSVFQDVPTLASRHAAVARELSQLLPENPQMRSLKQAVSAVAVGHLGSSGAFWAILAIIFFLVQNLFTSWPGSGQ